MRRLADHNSAAIDHFTPCRLQHFFEGLNDSSTAGQPGFAAWPADPATSVGIASLQLAFVVKGGRTAWVLFLSD